MVPNPGPLEAAEIASRAVALDALHGALPPLAIIERSLDAFGPDIAAVSSFGADSAVLLHMIAQVDSSIPVIFLDTGKHFDETLDYRDALAVDFGLRDVRSVAPDPDALARLDPAGSLHATDTDGCCAIRKVEPLARALEPFGAWFTGRKRHQASTRNAMQVFESVGTRIRVNPLARFTTQDQADYMRRHVLRENPLVPYGYLSIGCLPCTQPVKPGEDARAGRWAGQAKVECGIHLSGLDHSLTDSSL